MIRCDWRQTDKYSWRCDRCGRERIGPAVVQTDCETGATLPASAFGCQTFAKHPCSHRLESLGTIGGHDCAGKPRQVSVAGCRLHGICIAAPQYMVRAIDGRVLAYCSECSDKTT